MGRETSDAAAGVACQRWYNSGNTIPTPFIGRVSTGHRYTVVLWAENKCVVCKG